ncbi:MAG: hypothetical protein HY075_16230 [Deltaproteobacteria bacterium]|nr:hypothetical protein [Deltaproteobacteria bacterium]
MRKRTWLILLAGVGAGVVVTVGVLAYFATRPQPVAAPAAEESPPAVLAFNPDPESSPELSAEKPLPPGTPEEQGCESGAPEPYFSKGAYRDHPFARFPGNRSEERIPLEGGAALTYKRYGCVDSVTEVLYLEIPGQKLESEEEDLVAERWTNVAISRLEPVKFASEHSFEIWRKLLAGVIRLKKTPKGAWQHAVCRDQSEPDADGCAWRTGGLNRFRVEQRGSGVLLTVVDESPL